MTTIKVSAPGKIHLLGEHSSVHGKPAILTTIDKRCYVSVAPRADRQIFIESQGIDNTVMITEEEIIDQTKKAQELLKTYLETNDINILKSITKNPLDYIVISIGETLLHYEKKLTSGFNIEINSQIPIGAGLGSSGVIAITVASAVALFLGEAFDKDSIYQIAYMIEQKKHGVVSGGDFSAPCFGGMVWFRKETDDLKIIRPLNFSLPEELAKNFVIIDTGKPEESTGEMVGSVRALLRETPEVVEKFLNSQEKLTKELLAVIKNSNESELMRIIKEGERNLENVGVVSDSTKQLIKKIEESDGAAKICGAGGKTKATGVLLAYHPNKKVLEKIAQENNLTFFSTTLGVEGLRVES